MCECVVKYICVVMCVGVCEGWTVFFIASVDLHPFLKVTTLTFRTFGKRKVMFRRVGRISKYLRFYLF